MNRRENANTEHLGGRATRLQDFDEGNEGSLGSQRSEGRDERTSGSQRAEQDQQQRPAAPGRKRFINQFFIRQPKNVTIINRVGGSGPSAVSTGRKSPATASTAAGLGAAASSRTSGGHSLNCSRVFFSKFKEQKRLIGCASDTFVSPLPCHCEA